MSILRERVTCCQQKEGATIAGSRGGDVGSSIKPYLAARGEWDVTLCVGGGLIEAKRLGGGAAGGRVQAERRGKVRGFSKRSRRRLKGKFGRLAKAALRGSLFVTLTYPEQFPDCTAAREHRRALEKRILRRWPRAGILWRLELQQRGAPHFHLLVLGVRFISCAWLAQAWYEVVGSGDVRHLNAGTQVQRVMHERQAKSYLEKYLSKLDSSDDIEGRSWGLNGNCESYSAEIVTATLNHQQFVRLARAMDGLVASWVRRGAPRQRRRYRRRSMVRRLRGVYDDYGRERVIIVRGFRWYVDGAIVLTRLRAIVGPGRLYK